MEKNKQTGRAGEAEAAEYLRALGYELIAMNWACRYGEIDIIAAHGRFVVFVEVKTRKSAEFAGARDYVTNAKQRRIRTSALLWLQQHGEALQPRFDVIEIYTAHTPHQINHIENAFE